ncbi:hypothetical protein MPER_07517 [Moniliophthora perniciosa FA553]|nr:hypothetical protein MPER_07517 [Moniliophthora perniciosa FA553]
MESSKPILTSFQSTDTLHSTSTLVDSSNGQEKSKLDTQNDDRAPGNVPIEATRIDKTEEIDVVPDGGFRAWLVIFGITCCTFTTFGLTSSWGFFQAYYQQSLLKSSSPSTIAWIGSIQYALAFLPCMIVGRLFDLGYFHSIFAGASMVLVLAIMLVAQCTVYWQLLLCQGFLTGLACGIIVGPTTAILAQWFKEKRALALGFTATGSALGGTLLPVTARALLPRIGFSWTVRVIGFIALTCLLLANLTIRRRLPPTYPKGPLLSVKPLKSIPFVTYCIATLLVYFGLYTFMTYVASTAVLNSVPEIFSFNLVAIMNGSSGIGRLAAGIIGNRIGNLTP